MTTLRLRTVFSLVLATLMIPLMPMGASAAEAQPRTTTGNESLGATAVPPGTPGPFKIRGQRSGLCLDVSPDLGTLESSYPYLYFCTHEDRGQEWGWFNGGYLINLARNQCLTRSSVSATGLRLLNCNNTNLQYWRHQNYAILSLAPSDLPVCVGDGTGAPESRVIAQICATTPTQGWDVTYWR
jgi:hypothetical protein